MQAFQYPSFASTGVVCRYGPKKFTKKPRKSTPKVVTPSPITGPGARPTPSAPEEDDGFFLEYDDRVQRNGSYGRNTDVQIERTKNVTNRKSTVDEPSLNQPRRRHGLASSTYSRAQQQDLVEESSSDEAATLTSDLPNFELTDDRQDWRSSFLLPRNRQKQMIAVQRRKLFGRGWRRLDVRYYLLKRAQYAKTYAAMLGQAEPQLQNARDDIVYRQKAALLQLLPPEIVEPMFARNESTAGSSSGHRTRGHEDSLDITDNSTLLQTNVASDPGSVPVAPIPQYKTEHQRGDGPFDDALPGPATFFKLPSRWKRRVLAERLVALRRAAPSLSPLNILLMYTSAPVLLTLTTWRVAKQVMAVAGALDVPPNAAARQIAASPCLGLLNADRLAIKVAMLSKNMTSPSGYVPYKQVASMIAPHPASMCHNVADIVLAAQRLAQALLCTERHATYAVLLQPGLVTMNVQTMRQRFEALLQLSSQQHGNAVMDAWRQRLDDSVLPSVEHLLQRALQAAMPLGSMQQEMFAATESCHGMIAVSNMLAAVVHNPFIFMWSPNTIQSVHAILMDAAGMNSEEAAQFMVVNSDAIQQLSFSSTTQSVDLASESNIASSLRRRLNTLLSLVQHVGTFGSDGDAARTHQAGSNTNMTNAASTQQGRAWRLSSTADTTADASQPSVSNTIETAVSEVSEPGAVSGPGALLTQQPRHEHVKLCLRALLVSDHAHVLLSCSSQLLAGVGKAVAQHITTSVMQAMTVIPGCLHEEEEDVVPPDNATYRGQHAGSTGQGLHSDQTDHTTASMRQMLTYVLPVLVFEVLILRSVAQPSTAWLSSTSSKAHVPDVIQKNTSKERRGAASLRHVPSHAADNTNVPYALPMLPNRQPVPDMMWLHPHQGSAAMLTDIVKLPAVDLGRMSLVTSSRRASSALEAMQTAPASGNKRTLTMQTAAASGSEGHILTNGKPARQGQNQMRMVADGSTKRNKGGLRRLFSDKPQASSNGSSSSTASAYVHAVSRLACQSIISQLCKDCGLEDPASAWMLLMKYPDVIMTNNNPSSSAARNGVLLTSPDVARFCEHLSALEMHSKQQQRQQQASQAQTQVRQHRGDSSKRRPAVAATSEDAVAGTSDLQRSRRQGKQKQEQDVDGIFPDGQASVDDQVTVDDQVSVVTSKSVGDLAVVQENIASEQQSGSVVKQEGVPQSRRRGYIRKR